MTAKHWYKIRRYYFERVRDIFTGEDVLGDMHLYPGTPIYIRAENHWHAVQQMLATLADSREINYDEGLKKYADRLAATNDPHRVILIESKGWLSSHETYLCVELVKQPLPEEHEGVPFCD
jgi:hypothetical protein